MLLMQSTAVKSNLPENSVADLEAGRERGKGQSGMGSIHYTLNKQTLDSMQIPSKHTDSIQKVMASMCIFNNFHWLPDSICLWRLLCHLGISGSDHKSITKNTD